MKPTSLLALAGAVGGTVLATAGVALLVLDDDSGETRPAASARAHQDASAIAAALRERGATGCSDGDPTRVECRYAGRYVAATVLTPDTGMTVDALAGSWRTGVGQSSLGELGPFALLQGPNWLVTGPRELVDKVRPDLGGQVLHCDRPFGTCS
ncbi:hypothetical protein [Actinomadura hibisca]|uniref:hypothetical protein n=1 Tax=Actinomadura hibisca TaxID=68565 RepID=UPI00082F189D|nr:hypothetical protein [Actinomadura hibisca]